VTKRIIVVDNDEMVLIAVAELLRSQGYTVLTAHNGEQALELAAGQRLDLAVLDAVMPGIAGRELAQRLRSQDARGRLPVILLSDRGADEDPGTPEDQAPLRLPKPIHPEQLIAMVESVLL